MPDDDPATDLRGLESLADRESSMRRDSGDSGRSGAAACFEDEGCDGEEGNGEEMGSG